MTNDRRSRLEQGLDVVEGLGEVAYDATELAVELAKESPDVLSVAGDAASLAFDALATVLSAVP